jgi:hypothetical protein
MPSTVLTPSQVNMAKKHRERRAKYVELLREKEKERDAYLEKRNRKRTRDEDEGDDIQGTSSRADDNTADLKKRRVDPAAAAPATVAAEVKTVTDEAEAEAPVPKKRVHQKKKY